MKLRLLAVAALLASATVPSQVDAAVIDGSATGLGSPAVVITFDEVALPSGTPVTNQFAAFGLTFSSGIYASPQTGYSNIVGADVGNFPGPVAGPYFNPVTLSFSTLQTAVAFALVSNNTYYSLEAIRDGVTVASFQTTIGFSSANDFYGFSGVSFDSIRISAESNDYFLIDNVQLSVAAVPEPSTWAMMILGLAGLGVMAHRRASKPASMAA